MTIALTRYCWHDLKSMLSKEYFEPDVAVKYISLGGVSTFLYQMTQIRQKGMINVIAWVIAGLIDGWPLLIQSLWQIMYFSSQEKEQKYRVGRKVPWQVGAILTVPSVMCVTSKLQLLWAVLRLIPAHVKRQPLTSGELSARREIIHF